MDYMERITASEDHDEIDSILGEALAVATVSSQEFAALCYTADRRHNEVTAMDNAISEEEKIQ